MVCEHQPALSDQAPQKREEEINRLSIIKALWQEDNSIITPLILLFSILFHFHFCLRPSLSHSTLSVHYIHPSCILLCLRLLLYVRSLCSAVCVDVWLSCLRKGYTVLPSNYCIQSISILLETTNKHKGNGIDCSPINMKMRAAWTLLLLLGHVAPVEPSAPAIIDGCVYKRIPVAIRPQLAWRPF